VDLQFAIPCDGILVIDFIIKYNCQLNFKPSEEWLLIRPNNLKFPIYVPITYSSGNNSIHLPARSQVIIFDSKSIKKERYSRVLRLSVTRYLAKGTKGKWSYASSKAGSK